MKPNSFRSKTTPWRVQIPSRYFNDGRRKVKYFKTKYEAEQFIKDFEKHGIAMLVKLNIVELNEVLKKALNLASNLNS